MKRKGGKKNAEFQTSKFDKSEIPSSTLCVGVCVGGTNLPGVAHLSVDEIRALNLNVFCRCLKSLLLSKGLKLVVLNHQFTYSVTVTLLIISIPEIPEK